MYAAAAGGAGVNIWRVYGYSADPNAAPRGALGATALRVALDFPDLATAEMSAAVLLSNGADPNLPQPGGTSPLHVAALRGSRDLVEFLIRKGADLDARDKDGRTPRELAESAGQHEVATMLERRREIPRDHSSSRAAHDASGGAYRAPDLSAYARIERERIVGASHTKLEVVREAVERHPELAHSVATTTERAVEACAHTGRHDIVDYLLSKGAPYSLPTANDWRHRCPAGPVHTSIVPGATPRRPSSTANHTIRPVPDRVIASTRPTNTTSASQYAEHGAVTWPQQLCTPCCPPSEAASQATIAPVAAVLTTDDSD